MADIIHILPNRPFDGQEFIDSYRIKWVYNTEDETWNKIGAVSDIPIARAPDDPAGPTNGLLSAKDKQFIDGLSPKAGGFGFILKPGYYLTENNAADNVLSGDVKLVSETLEFVCSDNASVSDCPTDCTNIESVPAIQIGLSQDFLESYSIEIKGAKGKKGKEGPQGRDGRPGTGDGPIGDAGIDGVDATVSAAFTGIQYEELDDIYDTAVVSMRLDAPNGILEITKAKMDVPDDDKPATRVTASPVIRDVEFLSADMTKWQLVSGDATMSIDTDLNVIRLPKGWVGAASSGGVAIEQTPVPVVAVKLSQIAQGIIDYYITQGDTIIAGWTKELNSWAVALDKSARDALFALAQQVAECQFQLPLEMCLGIEPADCKSLSSGSPGTCTPLCPQFSHTCDGSAGCLDDGVGRNDLYVKCFDATAGMICQDGGGPYAPVRFIYTAYGFNHQFQIIGNDNSILFDSGCASLNGAVDLKIYGSSNPFTLKVVANCDSSAINFSKYKVELICEACP